MMIVADMTVSFLKILQFNKIFSNLYILSSIYNLNLHRKCKMRNTYQEASRKRKKRDIHYMVMQMTTVLSLQT